jgi:cell division septum initiation protein DivIVA
MSLSESASAQVQAILQAAEASAEQIKREAKEEADRIRAAARETRQADVSGLTELVGRLREDLDALEARLRGLDEPESAPVAEAPKEPAAAAEPANPVPAAGDEAESARLIALNMALNGESREATDKYLAENFDLGDREALLDEVYASVGG